MAAVLTTDDRIRLVVPWDQGSPRGTTRKSPGTSRSAPGNETWLLVSSPAGEGRPRRPLRAVGPTATQPAPLQQLQEGGRRDSNPRPLAPQLGFSSAVPRAN